MGTIEDNSGINVKNEDSITVLTEEMLTEARNSINCGKALSIPIAGLSTLGAGVASLIPALNTITQTTTIPTEGLFRLANANVGDTLKVAKNGNFWGAYKNTNKFVQLKEAGPLSATSKTTAPINPAMMMMAVALFSIEKELGRIADMEKQIISFLEIEKESEIEADVETLMGIVTNYKINWDNENYVTSNHKLVLDIQRTARKNILVYQKMIDEIINSNKLIVDQSKVKSTLADLEKKFQYYRLSLYIFSLASVTEVMLGGNFKEEYIIGVKDEICLMSEKYRELFSESSIHLEKMGNHALDTNIAKGIGTAGKTVGKLIGQIPIVKKGPVDEFLQDAGENLKRNAEKMEKNAVRSFAEIGNPHTGMFVEKLNTIIKIYNHTSQIFFDKDNIYLLTE